MIDTLALLGSDLTNVVGGHGSKHGWRPLEEIVVEYAAEPVEIAPEHRVALIRIRRRFAEVRTPEDLYEITRQWWVVAPNRRKPDYAFSIYNGIVRAVYKISSWERERGGAMRGRWAFHGERDPEMEEQYLSKDVSRYLSLERRTRSSTSTAEGRSALRHVRGASLHTEAELQPYYEYLRSELYPYYAHWEPQDRGATQPQPL